MREGGDDVVGDSAGESLLGKWSVRVEEACSGMSKWFFYMYNFLDKSFG